MPRALSLCVRGRQTNADLCRDAPLESADREGGACSHAVSRTLASCAWRGCLLRVWSPSCPLQFKRCPTCHACQIVQEPLLWTLCITCASMCIVKSATMGGPNGHALSLRAPRKPHTFHKSMRRHCECKLFTPCVGCCPMRRRRCAETAFDFKSSFKQRTCRECECKAWPSAQHAIQTYDWRISHSCRLAQAGAACPPSFGLPARRLAGPRGEAKAVFPLALWPYGSALDWAGGPDERSLVPQLGWTWCS